MVSGLGFRGLGVYRFRALGFGWLGFRGPQIPVVFVITG